MKKIVKKLPSIIICIVVFISMVSIIFLTLKVNYLQKQIDQLIYLVKTPVFFRNQVSSWQLTNFKDSDRRHQYNINTPPGFFKLNENTLIYFDENGSSQGIYFNSKSVSDIVEDGRERGANIQEIIIDGKFWALKNKKWEIIEVKKPNGDFLRYYLTEFDGEKYGIIFTFPEENSGRYVELFHSIVASWFP